MMAALLLTAGFAAGHLCPSLLPRGERESSATSTAPALRESPGEAASLPRVRELLARRQMLEAALREVQITCQLLRARGWREDSEAWDQLLHRQQRIQDDLAALNARLDAARQAETQRLRDADTPVGRRSSIIPEQRWTDHPGTAAPSVTMEGK